MTFAVLLAACVGGYAVLAYRSSRTALALLGALLPFYLVRTTIAGIPVTALELCVFALLLMWVLRHGRDAFVEVYELPVRTRAFWLGVFVLIILTGVISVWVAPDRMAALGILKAYILEPIAITLVSLHLIRTPQDRERLAYGWLGGGIVVALSVLVQWVLDTGIPAPWDVERRATGLFPYPNAAGLYLAPLVSFAAAWLMRGVSSRYVRALTLSMVLLGSLALIATQTEAAWIAVPAALGIAALTQPTWRTRTLAILGGLVLLACIGPWRTHVFEKLSLHDRSGLVRRAQWHEAVAYLQDHPLTGAGLAGYPMAIAPYHEDASIEIFQYPHTLVLNQWMETGIMGVVLLAILIGLAIRGWMQSLSDPFLYAVGVALLAMCIHGLADVPFWKNDLSLLTWVLFACLIPYVRPPTTSR